jgi:GT2 family glycosyltransferase
MGNAACEVIVVDNASADNTLEMIKSEFSQVILIENDKNLGFAAGNNQGISLARGRYILLLNSDTVVLDNAIEKVVSYADGHPETAVVGCQVLNADKTLQPTCFMYPSLLNLLLSSIYLYKLFPTNKFFGRERMTWWNRADEREVEAVTGCFMMVRREAVESVGLLDEDYFMYGEETDWCFRFHKAGWSVQFTPIAQIIHLGGASSSQKKPEMLLQLRGSILLFLKKHRSFVVYGLASLLVSLFFLLRVPYWFTKSLLCRSQRNVNNQKALTYIRGALGALTGGRKLLLSR